MRVFTAIPMADWRQAGPAARPIMEASCSQDPDDAEVSITLRSGPPKAAVIHTSLVEGEVRKKAMERPSGDQEGCRSCAGLVVSRNGSPAPSTGLM